MYDFTEFIELLNNPKTDPIDAFKLVKDHFHLGKIEIKNDNIFDSLEFIVDDNFSKEITIDIVKNGYVYSFYKIKDEYVFNNSELNDIKSLLILISLSHANFLLRKKAEEAELISLNTRLPNSHGFFKIVNILSNTVDVTNYNCYYINIKGFGLVNKIFGQKSGDDAIKSYANELHNFIDKDEVIGHLGGDNFVAFIKRKRHKAFVDLATMCKIIINKDNKKSTVNLIGIVGYYEIKNAEDIQAGMISNASMACQYARNTKKIVVEHTQELEELVNSVKRIESTFKTELKNGNFVVYYQPKFDIKSGKIIGVEALSRWISNGKIVPPGMFVPILEKNGEILQLDLFVLEKLCSDIHNYRSQGYNIVPASCNLSRRDFENVNLEETVINIIKKYNVKTEDIVIEVTETTNLEENERLSKFINTMHENGIMTSIDDFGTGYSSLSVLRDFKVNEIKIDRSFINREILTDSDEIIIGSIIDMAKRLNINVICEGVETKSQAEFLINLGCNNAQGFLYSKPLPKLEFEALMRKIGTIYD